MSTSRSTVKKASLASVLLAMLALLLAGSFVLMGNTQRAHADATVTSWSDLRAAVANGGTITLGNNVVWDGTPIEVAGNVTIVAGDGTTISTAQAGQYSSMFIVGEGGNLTIGEGVVLSGQPQGQGCDSEPAVKITAEQFTGAYEEGKTTYTPKGFFIDVKGGGTATLNGTISGLYTSRDKATTPRYIAPVVANGKDAVFNLGSTGTIKNNLVGYIVDDSMANNDAQSIKQYVKGAGPNVPRVPNATTQQANRDNFGGRPRSTNAGIDQGVPGSGITATAGAVIYKGGAKGSIEGAISNNRADTGGIMASGENTQVNIKGNTLITNNVGVQFGGGSTAEQGGSILMQGGIMQKNVAWFGGGAVYATENGVDWLLGLMNGDDGLHPQFDDRKDGVFFMTGGELTENTAFTRGGAVLADSDGINIQGGKLSYNMARMLGGAMYVMGDHPKYEYTVFMTQLYVHDNAAVSGESVARKRKDLEGLPKQPTSDILATQWGASDWESLNAPMQTMLKAPSACDLTSDSNILDSTVAVTGGKGGGNTDDYLDGVGAQGTGGGVWLCAYGNTVFEANEPDKVVITNNYATGAPTIGSGGYHKNLLPGDRADAENNSVTSDQSRSGIASGSDFHADTGGKGTVVINGLTDQNVKWYNENTGEKYESTVSGGRLNLINKNENLKPDNVAVEVVGNLARHGGGLAADGTFYFGTLASQATPGATIEVEKEWANTAAKKPITIRATVKAADGKTAVLADVPLDGEANPPATEFDTVHELEPAGNTWRGEFGFPMSTTTEGGETIKLYTLVYAGAEPIDIPNTQDKLTTDTELDPLSPKGRIALAAVLEANKQDDIKVLFGEPEYATTGDLRKVAKEGDTYKVSPITISYTEMEENSQGKLVECDDFVFIPGEMDLANLQYQINSVPKHKTTINDKGEIVEIDEVLYTIHLFSIPLTAPMSNDNWPLTEKYVNKDVHADIVNFDQTFTYDIMAYVPLSATELTISDTLVEGLEFADKDGNPTTDPKEAIQSITMKMANNHLPGEEGTAASGDVLHTKNGNPIDFIAWGKNPKWTKYLPEMAIEGNTLSVKFDKNEFDKDPSTDPNDTTKNIFDVWLPGRWIQVTFNARIKDEYRNLDALKELQAQVDGKTTSWEGTDTNKQAPGAHDVSFANGDLSLVEALLAQVGPDPIDWAVEGPSRLFARSIRGEYYATPMNDKLGEEWVLLEEGSADWKNADNRFNGRKPEADNTGPRIGLDDKRLRVLLQHPQVLGHKLVKGAEGGSRLFVQTEDAQKPEPGTHYFATPNNDKSGATWTEITPADGAVYTNAKARLEPDSATIRMLDLTSGTITLKGDGKNWPVVSEEEHEGMVNQASYNVKFGNNAEGTYKTNNVTIAPETTELDVEKVWANSNEWPEGVDNVTFGVFAVKDGVEKAVYVKDKKVVGCFADKDPKIPEGAEKLTVELTKDDPATEDVDESKATVKDLPKLIQTTYVAREILINGKEPTYNDAKTIGKAEDNYFASMSSAIKQEEYVKASEQIEEELLVGTEADDRLWVMTETGKYYATAKGDTSGKEDTTTWTEIAAPEGEAEPSELYVRAQELLGSVAADGAVTPGTDTKAVVVALTKVFTALNAQASTEKYVNNDVHADLGEFDKAFKYDIMTYVPVGTTELTITDNLVKALEFAKAKDSLDDAEGAAAEKATSAGETIVAIVSKKTNDHTADSTVAGKDSENPGTAITPKSTSIENNTLRVTFEGEDDPDNDGVKLPLKFAGEWVQVTFWAKYTDEVIEAANIGDIEKVKENGAVISQKYPADGQGEGDDKYAHDGTVNQASAEIKVGNDFDSVLNSNEVTVKPDTTNVYAQKKLLPLVGDEALTTWPAGLNSVTFSVFKNDGETETKLEDADMVVKDLQVQKSKDLPKLIGVTYTVKETAIDGTYEQEGDVEGEGTEDKPFVITNRNNDKPQVEKYVNNDVTYDFESFDQVFEYEIMAYVTSDGNTLTVTDELNDMLEFVAGENDETGANVKAYKMGAVNDHATTVKEAGEEIEPTTVKVDGRLLEVTFDPADDLRGQWVKVTFTARIAEDAYETAAAKIAEKAASEAGTAADEADVWANFAADQNLPVKIEKIHDGVPNTAKYTLETENNGTFNEDTNTVTVEPKTTSVDASKVWLVNDKVAAWPAGATVEVLLTKNGEPVEGMTATMMADDPATEVNEETAQFINLPCLEGVTYGIAEGKVAGFVGDYQLGAVEEVEPGVFQITNTYKPGQPEVEKYVNNDVHADLVEFDRVFKYDILAYVTSDAKTVTITDTLVPSLEFADGLNGVDKAAVKSTDPKAVVTAIQAKETNDHTANGTVAAAGIDVSDFAEVELLAEGRTLQVSFSDADAANIRGQWVQVTFWAKYTDAIIDAVKIGDTATITDNGAVVSEIAEHDGTTNQGSYKIEADNGYKYEEDTNVVTVKPETTTLKASKKWLDPAGKEMTTWPTDVQSVVINVMNGKEVVTSLTISDLEEAVTEELPKLVGVEYTLEEGAINYVSQPREGEGYSLARVEEGNVFVNQKSELTQVQITKVWAGARLDEVMSIDEFKNALRLTCDSTDVTKLYADKLTVVDRGTFTYVATWSDLPVGLGEYAVEELPVAGYTSKFEGLTLTNTKVREEKPEIEKYVNQAVHKDIAINDTFTYDVVAYVTPDADTVTITDTLNDTLTFAGTAADVAVVDLGEANNHKVTFDVAATKVNDDATVAAQAQAVKGAQVSIEGKTLTVSIANKLEQVTDESGKVVGAKNAADEQFVTPLRGHWVRVTFTAKVDGKTLEELKKAYATIDPKTEEKRAADNVGNAPVLSSEGHTGVPNTASYTIGVGNQADVYGDTSNTVTVRPEESFDVKISKTDLGGSELAGATIKVTGPDGFEEEWVSSDKPHELRLVPGEYTMVEVVAPAGYQQVTTTIKFKVADDGTVTVLNAEEVDGGGNVKVMDADHIVLADAPIPTFDITISKTDLGGTEIEGAKMELRDQDGNLIEAWTSATEAHSLKLKPGRYTLVETVAPEGFDRVTTEMVFEVDAQGNVKLITTEVNNGGAITAEGGHIDLADAPIKYLEAGAATIRKAWDDNGNDVARGPVTFQAEYSTDGETWTPMPGKTVVVSQAVDAGNGEGIWQAKFENLPALINGVEASWRAVEVASVEGYGNDTAYGTADGFAATNRVNDNKRGVLISKQAVGGGPELPGAKLQILDKDGNVIQEWISGEEPHLVRLEDGEYTLREITAPNGYEVAEDMQFKIENGVTYLLQNGEWIDAADHVVMFDAPTPIPQEQDEPQKVNPKTDQNPAPAPKSSTPATTTTTTTSTVRGTTAAQTSDAAGVATLAIGLVALTALGTAAYSLRRRRAQS